MFLFLCFQSTGSIAALRNVSLTVTVQREKKQGAVVLGTNFNIQNQFLHKVSQQTNLEAVLKNILLPIK